MAVDSGVDIKKTPGIELTPNQLRATIIFASTLAFSLITGSYVFLRVMPEISSHARAQAVLTSLEESPVGSQEFMDEYESQPKNIRESSIQMVMFDEEMGLEGEWAGACSATIVDEQGVKWVDQDGQLHFGFMYTGLTADHCFGGYKTDHPERFTPSKVQIFTSKNIIDGDVMGEPAIFLDNEQIAGMDDGAKFSFLVPDNKITLTPLGIENIQGGSNIEGNLVSITFPEEVNDHSPRVFEFFGDGVRLPLSSKQRLEGYTVHGESGSNFFDLNGNDRGLIIEEAVYQSNRFNITTFPDDIREQILKFVDQQFEKNAFEKSVTPGFK